MIDLFNNLKLGREYSHQELISLGFEKIDFNGKQLYKTYQKSGAYGKITLVTCCKVLISKDLYKIEEVSVFSEMTERLQNGLSELYDYRDKFVFDTLKSLGYKPKKTKEYYKNLKKRLDKNNIKLSLEMKEHKGIIIFKIIYVKDNKTHAIASKAFRVAYN